ncbi:MAG TPA: DedA family protein [Anaeromyxobacter sp.]|nr:DedA family protein [Anaeromyxobacter sp.]
MTSLEGIAGAVADAVSRTGPAAPAILFAATLVEYVFPPFPGDLVVVLGAWYAVDGAISWPVALVAVTAGALAGAWIDYRVGAALGPRLDRRLARRSPLSEERLRRFESSYRRWGVLLLLANRFLPGVRAFLFVAAGASGIPLRTVLLFGGISAIAWNVVLLAVGGLAVHNSAELVAFVEQYTRVAWAVLAAGAAIVAVVVLWRRREAARASRAEGDGR